MATKAEKEKYINSCGAMRINPYFVGNPDELYPDLIKCKSGLENPEFQVSDIHYPDYVRYCAFVLDPNSPLIRDNVDMKARRAAAEKMVGFRGYKDRRFEVNMLKYIFKNKKYTLLCTIQNIFDDYTEKANMEINLLTDEKKLMEVCQLKTKLKNDMRDLIVDEENLIRELFFNDDELMEAYNQSPESPEEMMKLLRANK